MKDSEMELTPWFPGDTKPARIGVYKVRYQTDVLGYSYSYWDGKYWHFDSSNESKAKIVGMHPMYISTYQNKVWRGILK